MIQTYGTELAEAGYPVCALRPSQKAPMQKSWQSNPLSAEACASFSPADAGVGIICGLGPTAVYGLDFDIPGDFEFAEEMRRAAFEILGEDAAYRVGMPPKFLIPVRGEPGAKKDRTPKFVKDGVQSQFEFLGDGQQFVAEGIHPATNLPYEWHGEALLPLEHAHLPISADMLPAIDGEKLAALQQKFCELASQHGWKSEAEMAKATPAAPFVDDYAPATEADLATSTPLGLTIESAKTYINGVDPSAYEEWLRVGMALHFEFSGSHEALLLWDEWSRKAGNYKSFEDLEYRWNGFGRGTGTPVTMATYKKRYRDANRKDSDELSDRGRAYRLYDIFGGRLWFTTDECVWYKWEGVHWRRLNDIEAGTQATYVTGGLLDEDYKRLCAGDPKAAKALKGKFDYFRKAAALSAIVAYAKQLPEFQCKSTDFDSDSRYFGVANGDIDLTTGEFLPPDSARKTSRCSPVVYDPEAKCPLWRQTVEDIFAGRPEMPGFVQRVFGYAMLGNPVEEKIFVFHGNGSNGKSTLLNTIRQIFGGYSVTMEDTTVTALGKSNGGNAGGSRADIVALKGKRLALVPETEAGASLREATVKRLVSLDAITARGTYARNMTTFTPTAVPILATNHMPEIRETDEGIWRRVTTISFNERFEGRKDMHRQDALKKELPGILNWLTEGALEYQRNGLQIPEEVIADTEGKRREFDCVQDWIDERCEQGAELYVRTSEALSSWFSWAKENAVSYTMTANKMGRMLHGKGVNTVKRKVNGRSGRYYKGIKLLDDFENLEVK